MTRFLASAAVLILTLGPAPAVLAEIRADAADLQPFGQSTFYMESAKNYPQLRTENRYFPGPMHPVFGFRRLISNEWLMGLGFNYKLFKERETADLMPVMAFSHESLRVLRLWHPVYLFAGFKMSYLLPVQDIGWPISRSDDHRAQVGVAATMTVAAELFPGWQLLARVDRWRGTANQRLHGLEAALGIGHPIQDRSHPATVGPRARN